MNPDGVGHEVAPALVLVGAGRGVERMEQPLPHAHSRPRKGVQERGLAGVRVPRQRYLRDGRRLAALAHGRADPLGVSELALQRRDAVAGQAPVGLDLGLAGPPGADPPVHAPRAKALEMRPQAAHAREVVFELCEFDLQLALRGVGVVGEDVQDHRGPVDDRHVQRRLQVALLARRELVVAGHEVGTRALDLLLQLGQLPAAEIPIRIGLGADLDELIGRGDAGGAKQLLQLGQRVLAVRRRARQRADRKGTLTRPRVAQACELAVGCAT